nr:MAG TPA: hypothetical protein [Bacteriophage sp.]
MKSQYFIGNRCFSYTQNSRERRKYGKRKN